MEEVVAPVVHEYVPPPPAVNVKGLPAQIVVEEVTAALGEELIVARAVSVAVFPAASVIKTEYVVVEVGQTVIAEVVCPDGFHE